MGPSLTALNGIGPSGAGRLLVEVGDVTRFTDMGHFASWTGTAWVRDELGVCGRVGHCGHYPLPLRRPVLDNLWLGWR